MPTRAEPSKPPRAARRRGFTLVEILVALGVVSIAALIAVSGYLTCLSYSSAVHSQKVAASLAEEHLTRIQRDPAAFVWPEELKQSEAQPVVLQLRGVDAAAPYAAEPPSSKALEPRAGRRETNFYEGFSWTPFAKLPKPDASYVEVSVVVRWNQSGRDQSLTLTTAVPLTQVEGLS